MKAVILAGGRGTRLAELTSDTPKPMIQVGGQPLLWHIMKIYAKHNITDFVILGGYKIDIIGAWLETAALPWQVQLLDTGLDTQTGGRIKKAAKHLGDRFMLTYGDGVANIDIPRLLKFHDFHQSFCTLTVVHPPARFGRADIDGDYVGGFAEKPLQEGWINGGFFVVDSEATEYIHGDEPWESGALSRLAQNYLLTAYRHGGFWQCCDTLREVELLNRLYQEGAPWI